MTIKIETPEEMAKRLRWEGIGGKSLSEYPDRDAAVIRADREVIATWCEEKADEADREAVEHDSHIDDSRMKPDDATPHMMRRERCEGQASAFRALASLLRSDR